MSRYVSIRLTRTQAAALLEVLADVDEYVDTEMFPLTGQGGVAAYTSGYQNIAKQLQQQAKDTDDILYTESAKALKRSRRPDSW